MGEQSEQAKAARYNRLQDVLEGLDLPNATAVFKAAQLDAQKLTLALEASDPAYQDLCRIVLWKPESIHISLKRGTLFREMLNLLCDQFSVRDTRTDIATAQKNEAYFQHIMNNVPLPWLSPPSVAKDLVQATFPFIEITSDFVRDVSGDQFFNAVYQGIGAISRGFDIARISYSEVLRSRLSKESKDTIPWHMHYVGGRSGSGKTILLDRIAYDALINGFSVFRCPTGYVDSQSFFERLRNTLLNSSSHILIIFDDALKLDRRGVRIEEISTMAPAIEGQQVTLVFAANWQSQSNSLPLHLDPAERERRLDTVSVLTASEVGALVEKVCWAERSGVIRDVRCTIPESQRAELLVDDRDRLMLLSLLKLRYAKNVREILREEFLSIDESKSRDLYMQITIMEALGCPLPKSILETLLPDLAHVSSKLRGLINIEEGRVHLRHPLLVTPTLDIVSDDLELRPDSLSAILLKLVRGGRSEKSVLFEFFVAERQAQRVSNFFKRSRESVIAYLDTLFNHAAEFSDCGLGAQFYGHLGTIEKDVLLEYGQAADRFEVALDIDPENVYCAKQLAWALLKHGDLPGAEKQARIAVAHFPDEPELISDCAYVMSWCTSEGFADATGLYSGLMTLRPGDEGLARRFERHLEGVEIARLASGAFEDYQYKEMRAPSFIWRVRRHAAKQYKRSLFGRLSGALRDSNVDAELLEEIAQLEPGGADAGLKGLIEAHSARQLYERWYHDQDQIDLDDLEQRFKRAIKGSPQEAFVPLWYGTFLKEARNDYEGAEREYKVSRQIAKDSKFPDVVEHPMILNNMALLFMDSVYTQKKPAEIGLKNANILLNIAMERMDQTKSRFRWPIDTFARLHAMASEFQISLPPTLTNP